jgi:hypothetical protein
VEGSVARLKDKAQLAVRAQGFEVEHRPPLAKQEAGGAAHQNIDIAADIDVGLLVLKAPEGEVGGGVRFAVVRREQLTWVISRRVRDRGFSAQVVPLKSCLTREARVRRSYIRPGSVLSREYEDRRREPNDQEAQEGQRPIAVHALEHLGKSDTGIALLRRRLREQIKRVNDGLDPMNVIREASFNQNIPTNAWNTILSAAEISAHQRESKVAARRNCPSCRLASLS